MQTDASASGMPTKRDQCRASFDLYLGQIGQSEFTDANHKESLRSLYDIDGSATLFEIITALENAGNREMVWNQWFSLCKTDESLVLPTQQYIQSLMARSLKADAGTSLDQKIEALRLFRDFHLQAGNSNLRATFNIEYVFAPHLNELKTREAARDDLRDLVMAVVAKRQGVPLTNEDLPRWLKRDAIMSPVRPEPVVSDESGAASSPAPAPAESANGGKPSATDGAQADEPQDAVTKQPPLRVSVMARDGGYATLFIVTAFAAQSQQQQQPLSHQAQRVLLVLAVLGAALVVGSQLLPDNPPSPAPFSY